MNNAFKFLGVMVGVFTAALTAIVVERKVTEYANKKHPAPAQPAAE